jgi:hypothetical protein
MNLDCTDNYKVLSLNRDLICLRKTNDLGDIYTKKGLEAGIALVDDGNGVTIGLDGRKLRLDYSEITELFTLLKLKKDLDFGLLQGELMEVRRKIK